MYEGADKFPTVTRTRTCCEILEIDNIVITAAVRFV